jgi:glutathione synthase/RimK-type ligase-like ATP-grasp enzyme
VILVIGSSADHVFPQLIAALRGRGVPFVAVDEDQPDRYAVESDPAGQRPAFRIRGGECTGERAVTAIFVRHAVTRTLDPAHIRRLGLLQGELNRAMGHATCPVINPPHCAYSNYAKPYQVQLLAAAGFAVPRSLVTNQPAAARRFVAELEGAVIFKGVSNVMTLAQVLTPERAERLDLLGNSPTLFQEYVAGVDYRVHVIGEATFVTRLVAHNEDYRQSLIVTDQEVLIEPAMLPDEVLARCRAITRQLGLVVSGIDFKETPGGRLVALELNPYPQFTFYEGRSGQPLTATIIDYLGGCRPAATNIYA